MTDAPDRPRIAVLVFPGSNDDRDAALALERLGAEPTLVWHAEPELTDVGAVVLPGGFSYGDYLRCGAIARFAPVMEAVRRFAHMPRKRRARRMNRETEALPTSSTLAALIRH